VVTTTIPVRRRKEKRMVTKRAGKETRSRLVGVSKLLQQQNRIE
jgi:hypothetical protein